jgi:AcrR family transcriptional regulator
MNTYSPDDRVSIKTICKRLDLQRSTFYKHFRGKKAMYHVPERSIANNIVRYRWGDIIAAIEDGKFIQNKRFVVSALDGERQSKKAVTRKNTKGRGKADQEPEGGATV